MIGNNIKSVKSLALQRGVPAASANLNNLSKEMQILKSEIALVAGFDPHGDVIFTTQSGLTLSARTDIKLVEGDKIRVMKSADSAYEVISIHEKYADNLAEHQSLRASEAYTKNLEAGLHGFADKSIKQGQILQGTYTSIGEVAGRVIELEEQGDPLTQNLQYEFQVKSLGLDSIRHTNSKLKSGLVEILDEILSDDDSQNTFAARLIENKGSAILLATEFGQIKIPGNFIMQPGMHLLLEIISATPLKTEFKPDPTINMDKIIAKLEACIKIFSGIIGQLGTYHTRRILYILSKILQHAKNEEITTDQVLDDIPEAYLADISKINIAQYIDDFEEVMKMVKMIVDEALSKLPDNTWFISHLPIYHEEQEYQPIYIEKQKDNYIRIISDLELTAIGAMQLDCLVKLSEATHKIASNKITDLAMIIRYKKNFPISVFEPIERDFASITKFFNTTATIEFQNTDSFVAIKLQDTQQPKEEFQSGQVIRV